jgi:hypothetical protein
VDSSSSIQNEVELRLIFNDVRFARRYLQGVVDRASDQQLHVLTFSMMRYLSLYVYESHRALTTVLPDLAMLREVDNADVIERSRHTVKLFDDTNPQLGGASGVTTQFGGIAKAHRDHFLDNTWFPPARVLETDMATYRYRRRLIATTATLAFHLGLPAELMRDNDAMGQALLSLSTGISSYISTTAAFAPWEGPSFMDVINLRAVQNKDVRASRFYGNRFDKSLSNEARAALVAFQCSVNFVALMVAEDPNPDSAEPVFKLKLVILYHVLSSLAKFRAAFGPSLGPPASSTLDGILSHPTTAVLTDATKKGLRNTLMHYRPSAAMAPRLSLNQPLYGLVEAYYPGFDFAGMTKLIDEHTRLVAESLDDWSASNR